jgi:hypothetical protein
VGKMKMNTKNYLDNLQGTDKMGDPGVSRRNISELITKN